jgi:hypothetical protein
LAGAADSVSRRPDVISTLPGDNTSNSLALPRLDVLLMRTPARAVDHRQRPLAGGKLIVSNTRGCPITSLQFVQVVGEPS